MATGLVAAACGSDGDKGSAASTTATTAAGSATTAGGTATTAAPTAAKKGGTLTIGAEQEPDCTDWIGICSGSSWGNWMMNVTTMPRPFNVVKEGENWVPKPSDILVGEPKLETSPKQKVTYRINPKAVWSTGDPISSEDFKYTWLQIAGPDAKDIYDTTGYNLIESVETPSPDTAVVTFKQNYAAWKGLFGSSFALLPSKILSGKDRNKEMASGYSFSGGPWKIDKWEKGVSITLVPNDKYWGDKPNLDKVVFKVISDTSAQFQAYKAGEVSAIYPQPQIAVVDAIKAGGLEGNSSFTGNTGNVEALWMNNSKAPFDVLEVRQAVAYAIDRDALVDRLFGPLGVKKAVQSFNPPIVSKYAAADFSVYKKDLTKVAELMGKAGYAKGADGIWGKGGAKASFVIRSTAGNKRRELTEEVLQAQLKDAGFEMTVDNAKSSDLFGKIAPAGDFQLALYAQVATFPDPSLSNLFDSKNIPSEANKNSGQNWTRTNIAAADPLLRQIDTELDDAKRVTTSKAAEKLLADTATSLPLDPLPTIFLWAKNIKGPTDNPVMGPFHNLDKWSLA